MCILKAEDLCKSYRTAGETLSVLSHVSFQMNTGEMTAVMGPSGSGKTTLLQELCGIDIPDSGFVKIRDTELTGMSDGELALFRRRRMGMIFQDFQLLESLNVKENILLPLILDKEDEESQERALRDIVTALDMERLLSKRITEISGGQKQRTAIARAFIRRPELVFADEPTGNLDRKSTEAVMECMKNMKEKYHAGILIVTHDSYVASLCDRVLLLKDGNISERSHNGVVGFLSGGDWN